MQVPNPECFLLQSQISTLQIVKCSTQTAFDVAKDQVVNYCENLDSGEYLGDYIAASNSVSKVQADIESRYHELCD